MVEDGGLLCGGWGDDGEGWWGEVVGMAGRGKDGGGMKGRDEGGNGEADGPGGLWGHAVGDSGETGEGWGMVGADAALLHPTPTPPRAGAAEARKVGGHWES